MTASNLSTTVNNALPYGANQQYGQHVESVVNALTEREYTLSDEITGQVVQRFGVSTEQVQQALTDLGMAVRPAPEPEPVVEELPVAAAKEEDESSEGKGKTKERVTALEAKVDALSANVSQLLELAQLHLGARA